MYYIPSWSILDPIVSILFTILTFTFSYRILKDTIISLMDTSPSTIDYPLLLNKLKEIDNVTEIHDTHLWSIG